jgi:hypothetical protein
MCDLDIDIVGIALATLLTFLFCILRERSSIRLPAGLLPALDSQAVHFHVGLWRSFGSAGDGNGKLEVDILPRISRSHTVPIVTTTVPHDTFVVAVTILRS